MTNSIRAHFDGQFIVPDEPVNLPANQPLVVWVEQSNSSNPAPVAQKWQPLNLPVDTELSKAIAEEPEFNIEES